MRSGGRDRQPPWSSACGRGDGPGPVTSAEIERCPRRHDRPRDRRGAGTGPRPSAASSYLFWSGEISSAGRTAQFERRYDLPERVLPARGAGGLPERPAPDGRVPRAGTHRRPGPWRGHPAVPAGLLPARARQARPAHRRPGRGRRAAAGEVAGLVPAGYLHRDARRPRRIARLRAAQPVRLADLAARAHARRSSASATGWRSTSPRRRGSTGTTCCRSCSVTGSSPASTSRPTGRPAVCACTRRTGSREPRPRPFRRWSASWCDLARMARTGRCRRESAGAA